MTSVIELTWKRGSAEGYTDRFPLDEFSRDVDGAERIHVVLGPRNGLYCARYRLDVSNAHARLDYTPFTSFNESRGMDIGVLEFDFADTRRTEVKTVFWNGNRAK